MSASYDVATLGGGCFWCVDAVLAPVQGIVRVVSGYAGGHVPNPTYKQICTGTTGHAEVVQVTFDPSVISYREVLDLFFAFHDPTTPNRQGNDVGPQYRSIILTHSEAQAETAHAVIAALTAEGVFDAPVVTQVEPLAVFYPAEDYHQDYFARNPYQPYCAFVISPKVQKLRAKYADRLKGA